MGKQPQQSAFAKMAADGKINSYSRATGGAIGVKFKDLFFSDGHRDLLDRWIDDETKVRVTIEPIDPNLPEP